MITTIKNKLGAILLIVGMTLISNSIYSQTACIPSPCNPTKITTSFSNSAGTYWVVYQICGADIKIVDVYSNVTNDPFLLSNALQTFFKNPVNNSINRVIIEASCGSYNQAIRVDGEYTPFSGTVLSLCTGTGCCVFDRTTDGLYIIDHNDPNNNCPPGCFPLCLDPTP